MVLGSCSDLNGGSHRAQVVEQPRDYPLLRSLLSAPPLCPMRKKQALMRHITSTMANDLLYREPTSRNTFPFQQSRRGLSRGRSQSHHAKRKGSTEEKEFTNSDSDYQSCSSPDTTVDLADSGPGQFHRRLDATMPLSREQHSFLFNLLNDQNYVDSQKLYLAAEMGISEEQVFQWISSQSISRRQTFPYNVPPVHDQPSATAQPIRLHHEIYGMVDYYPMIPSDSRPSRSLCLPRNEEFGPQYKRMRYGMSYTNQSHIEYYYSNFRTDYYPTYDVNYGQAGHQPGFSPGNISPTFMQSPIIVEQYGNPENSRYQMISPPAEEPAQQAPATPQGNFSSGASDSFFWEDLESSMQSSSSLQYAPQYEDISPVSESPSSGFFPLGCSSDEDPSFDSAPESSEVITQRSADSEVDLVPVVSPCPMNESPTKVEEHVKQFLELF